MFGKSYEESQKKREIYWAKRFKGWRHGMPPEAADVYEGLHLLKVNHFTYPGFVEPQFETVYKTPGGNMVKVFECPGIMIKYCGQKSELLHGDDSYLKAYTWLKDRIIEKEGIMFVDISKEKYLKFLEMQEEELYKELNVFINQLENEKYSKADELAAGPDKLFSNLEWLRDKQEELKNLKETIEMIKVTPVEKE